jgi:hypothetical protein
MPFGQRSLAELPPGAWGNGGGDLAPAVSRGIAANRLYGFGQRDFVGLLEERHPRYSGCTPSPGIDDILKPETSAASAAIMPECRPLYDLLFLESIGVSNGDV